jgi:hypothetical protein
MTGSTRSRFFVSPALVDDIEGDLLEYDRRITALAPEADELGISAERLYELRAWDFHPQNHYSLETRRILTRFQMAFQELRKIGRVEYNEHAERAEIVNRYWKELVRARIAETGTPWYLDKEQYRKAANGHAS